MSAKLSLGMAQGFRRENDVLRARNLQDAQLATQAEDRSRRIAREDEQDANARVDRTSRLKLQDAQMLQVQQQQADQEGARQQNDVKATAEATADLIDGLMAGSDPAQAVELFNQRAPAHKFDATKFQWDPGTKTITVIGDDGAPRQVNAIQARADAQRVLTSSTAPPVAPKLEHFKDDELVKDSTGAVVHKGPLYGKEKAGKEPQRFINSSKGVFDTVTQTYASEPNGGTSDTTAGGSKRSTFNLQTAQKEARAVVGDRIGMKFDKDGNQTGDGNSILWSQLSSVTDDLAGQYEDSVGAGQLGAAVADAFEGMPTKQEAIDEAVKRAKSDEPRRYLGAMGPTAESLDAAEKRARTEAATAWQANFDHRASEAAAAVKAAAQKTLQSRGIKSHGARTITRTGSKMVNGKKVKVVQYSDGTIEDAP